MGILTEDIRRVLGRNPAITAMDGQTVMITGAGGFLGSALVAFFAEAARTGGPNVEVWAYDNFLTGLPTTVAPWAESPNIHLVRADVTKEPAVYPDAQWAIHAASIASPTYYRRYPIETIQVNVGGTQRLLEWARTQPDLRGLLIMSSSEVYGDPEAWAIPTPEDYVGRVSFTGPRACYDESKRLGETLTVNYVRRDGIPAKIARPFNVFGPGLRRGDRRVIPDFFHDAIEGQPIKVLSDGRATRTFCYLEDALDGLFRIWIQGEAGAAYNLGTDEGETSIAELAAMVSTLVTGEARVARDVSDDPQYVTDNPQRRAPNLTRLRGLGYRPSVSLLEGLARTYQWYRDEEVLPR
jgi:UDP-glucuronate decarboxylase